MKMLKASPQLVFPWRTANSIHFLIDGEKFYPAMLDAILHAEKYILLEMYLFESGDIADQFIQAFIQAEQRGVCVQLLVDAYGALGLSKKDRLRMTQAGIHFILYNPLKFKKFKHNLFRTHRKYLIIDGEKVFVGGAGITDSFWGKNAWRETVIEVHGRVVADWQALFVENVSQWADIQVPSLNVVTPKNHRVRMRLAYTKGGTRLEIKKVLLNRINNSTRSIWFASAYFVPSRKIRKALRKAAVNGKDVCLLLPGDVTDHPTVRYASRRYYARLLRFGVRIFEYQGRFTHTKMVLIDDWFTIGSSNMDRWNFRWNLEANQEVEDKVAAHNARTILHDDFKNCIEIEFQAWINRSRMLRLKEWLWGKFDIILTKYI